MGRIQTFQGVFDILVCQLQVHQGSPCGYESNQGTHADRTLGSSLRQELDTRPFIFQVPKKIVRVLWPLVNTEFNACLRSKIDRSKVEAFAMN